MDLACFNRLQKCLKLLLTPLVKRQYAVMGAISIIFRMTIEAQVVKAINTSSSIKCAIFAGLQLNNEEKMELVYQCLSARPGESNHTILQTRSSGPPLPPSVTQPSWTLEMTQTKWTMDQLNNNNYSVSPAPWMVVSYVHITPPQLHLPQLTLTLKISFCKQYSRNSTISSFQYRSLQPKQNNINKKVKMNFCV